jgi:sepiapterin reductase
VFCQAVDLSDSNAYTAKVDELVAQLMSAGPYSRVFVVHNAGQLGALGFAQECPSPAEMAPHWELNVNSVLWMNKRFLDAFGASHSEIYTPSRRQTATCVLVLVNVSSRSAIAPYLTLNLYYTAKAAREMHFRVLAAEQSSCNKVRVLSYSPGAMDTEMQKTMRESPRMAPELATWFVEMKEQGTLVPTAKSSHRLVVTAVNGGFESGKHVTFDDLNHVDEP